MTARTLFVVAAAVTWVGFSLALVLLGRWHYRRGLAGNVGPPYADSFLLLSRLRGRTWPTERPLPVVGLHVMMAISFIYALHNLRLYLLVTHEALELLYASIFATATVALAARRPWGWPCVLGCLLAILIGILLRSFPHVSIGLADSLVASLYGLLVLYVWRRHRRFLSPTKLPMAP